MPKGESFSNFETFYTLSRIQDHKPILLTSRLNHPENTSVHVKNAILGGDKQVVIAGPCSIESEEGIYMIAEELSNHGIKFLRGGAYKPRTSPYSFQGLGKVALEYLHNAAEKYHMVSVCEVLDPRDIETTSNLIDILQIGSRNMTNYALLKEVSLIRKPVLLKRGMGSTVEEFIYAAEYILSGGNAEVILCERGIRTFETQTRFTLDIAAIAILKKETHLPVIADVSHSSGRSDLVIPLSRASLAAGADGIMVEVHPHPTEALSDAIQQLSFPDFENLILNIQPFIELQ